MVIRASANNNNVRAARTRAYAPIQHACIARWCIRICRSITFLLLRIFFGRLVVFVAAPDSRLAPCVFVARRRRCGYRHRFCIFWLFFFFCAVVFTAVESQYAETETIQSE